MALCCTSGRLEKFCMTSAGEGGCEDVPWLAQGPFGEQGHLGPLCGHPMGLAAPGHCDSDADPLDRAISPLHLRLSRLSKVNRVCLRARPGGVPPLLPHAVTQGAPSRPLSQQVMDFSWAQCLPHDHGTGTLSS